MRQVRRLGLAMLPPSRRAGLRRLYERTTTPHARARADFTMAADAVAIALDAGPGLRVVPESRADVECHFLNPRQAAELACFLRVAANTPGRLFDVGANNGLFSLLFCLTNPENRAVAFEPSAVLSDRIARNGVLNGIADRQAIVSKAAGCTRGSLRMAASAADGYVQVAQFAGTGGPMWRDRLVEVTTIDEVAARLGPPSLIKIDVEGYESEVLLGATAVLTTWRPVVLLELHLNFLDERGIRPIKVLRILASSGYRLFHLSGRAVSARRAAASWASVVHLVARPE